MIWGRVAWSNAALSSVRGEVVALLPGAEPGKSISAVNKLRFFLELKDHSSFFTQGIIKIEALAEVFDRK